MDTNVKRKKKEAPGIDIGQETRLELYRMQVDLRYCEKRAYDLFLQNLVKGTSHLSLGQEAVAAGFDSRFVDTVLRRIRTSQFKRGPPVIAKVSRRDMGHDFLYPRDWGM